jgi:hypothetical protein
LLEDVPAIIDFVGPYALVPREADGVVEPLHECRDGFVGATP